MGVSCPILEVHPITPALGKPSSASEQVLLPTKKARVGMRELLTSLLSKSAASTARESVILPAMNGGTSQLPEAPQQDAQREIPFHLRIFNTMPLDKTIDDSFQILVHGSVVNLKSVPCAEDGVDFWLLGFNLMGLAEVDRPLVKGHVSCMWLG